MRVYDDGVYRDIREDEVINEESDSNLTTEDRIALLEEQLEATKILLGVE